MNVFIGAVQAAKSNWKDILGDPKKPGNWKQETYDQKKEELRTKQAEEAPVHLAAGYPVQMAIITDAGEVTVGTPQDILAKLELLNPTRIFGFNTLEILRQAAWYAADKITVPPWVWNVSAEPQLINLYSCSGAKHDSDLSLQQFITYWVSLKQPINAEADMTLELPPEIAQTEVVKQAYAVYQIAKRMGF